MIAFQLHETVIANYRECLKSFIRIRDRRIREYVEKKFDEKSFIPEPIMQFNPSYQRGESLEDLHARGVIHPGLLTIGTLRGVLHCKTENTEFNTLLLPTINVTEMIKEDVVLKIDES